MGPGITTSGGSSSRCGFALFGSRNSFSCAKIVAGAHEKGRVSLVLHNRVRIQLQRTHEISFDERGGPVVSNPSIDCLRTARDPPPISAVRPLAYPYLQSFILSALGSLGHEFGLLLGRVLHGFPAVEQRKVLPNAPQRCEITIVHDGGHPRWSKSSDQLAAVNLEFCSIPGFSIPGVSASDSDFAMAFGGGLDVDLTKRVLIRAGQADYLLQSTTSAEVCRELAAGNSRADRFESDSDHL